MRRIQVTAIIVLALGAASVGETRASSPWRECLPREPGIWRQRCPANSLSLQHEQKLVESLRRITGFCELQFGSDGLLSTGPESTVKGGAITARAVLKQALHSGVIFVVEDHSGSDAVHFGQLEPFWFTVTEPRTDLEINRVRLDFKDFRQMEAAAPVREAFDEGFTLIHELLHGLGYEDAFDESEVGPCEQIVNQVRAELGLVLRAQYLADAVPVTEQFTTLRLRFRSSPSARGGKSRSYYLFFLVRDDLKSVKALAEAARATRARMRANPDRRIAVTSPQE
jgi:hypothetical protein